MRNVGLVSVVIPFLENEDELSKCLQTLQDQSWGQLEIIIVDNGSRLKETPATASKVISNRTNEGFSKAINQGYRASQGEFLLALNADAFLDRDYIQNCMATMKAKPEVAAVTGKLLKVDPPGSIDTTGHLLLADRTVRDRGEWEEDRGQYDLEGEVFSIPATAALYRMSALSQLESETGEVFDEDFFAYGEDVDLAWRLRLLGWGLAYTPLATAHHRRSVSQPGRRAPNYVTLLDVRNRWLRIVKNDDVRSFTRHSLTILQWEVRQFGGMILKSPALIPRVIAGFIRRLPGALRKRRRIQRARLVGRKEIERWQQRFDSGISQ